MRSLAAFVAIALMATPALGIIEDGSFQSPGWGVSVVAPRNWQLSEQTSYPNILLWMSRRSPDGKMLLTAEKLIGVSEPRTYALKTAKVLRSMGFTVRAPQLHSATGAYWADFDNGSSYLRQAYLVKDGAGFTLTLSAPSGRLRNQHLRAFDASLRSIAFSKVESPKSESSAPAQPQGKK